MGALQPLSETFARNPTVDHEQIASRPSGRRDSPMGSTSRSQIFSVAVSVLISPQLSHYPAQAKRNFIKVPIHDTDGERPVYLFIHQVNEFKIEERLTYVDPDASKPLLSLISTSLREIGTSFPQ